MTKRNPTTQRAPSTQRALKAGRPIGDGEHRVLLLRLRRARIDRERSMRWLAAQIGVHETTIFRWERLHATAPTWIVRNLERALGVKPGKLQ